MFLDFSMALGFECEFWFVKAALKEIRENFDHTFHLFRLLYDRFIHDFLAGKVLPGAGDEDHYELVFNMSVNHPILSNLDEEFGRSRWCQCGQKFKSHK